MKSYLSADFFKYSFLFLMVIYFFVPYYIFLFIAGVFVLTAWLFRQTKNKAQGNESRNPDLLISPVEGFVRKIKTLEESDYASAIQITIPYFSEVGLSASTALEVDKVEGGGRSSFRYKDLLSKKRSRSGLKVFMKNDRRGFTLEIISCLFGGAPKLWVREGDRASVGSRIGHLPLGGNLIVWLPQGYQILVKEGQKLKISETAIASLRT